MVGVGGLCTRGLFVSTADKDTAGACRPSPAVAVRNLHHARAPRQFVDQALRGGAVLLVEIGVPFVEQIDRCIGELDDLLERPQLPLTRREAALAPAPLGLGRWLGGRR